ncbi:Uncharacterized protein FKW44_002648 [Caligus rogercresseyi]|uniref:Uncharacterized protein n=1 Tax=Caligus rogercresseyi TaxID=217165 RepID=A0A7T8KKW7_CALRO|nr:Uncharacterized protein FKW44_002648 [Caligus rogercresseyi]
MDEISETNGLLLFRQRLIIPRPLRREVLRRLHASHQGLSGRSAARGRPSTGPASPLTFATQLKPVKHVNYISLVKQKNP